MADIDLSGVGKTFAGTPALQDITTRFDDGEFIALLGPSGCGKTTLLRILAGFEAPSYGRLRIGTREMANARTGANLPPEVRKIGFVFQSYALWPHMSVRRNISYPLEIRKLSKAEIANQTDAALASTGLVDYADRMPSDLSGGQRQRVALARCLVSDPCAVLLDEPLANLDVALRATMQGVFTDFHKRTGATMVYVTHDQTEAMAMADRIAVMDQGRIQQFDTPQTLYERPKNRFVAEFVGRGAVVPVQELKSGGNAQQARILGAEVAVQSASQEAQVSHVCLRPENLTITETGDLRSKVARVTYVGGKYLLEAVTDCGARLFAETRARFEVGTQLGLTITTPWAFWED
ncbi:putative spermidine/putrescine import ATP-binding protein (plasmid) [Phaeobacter inhibens]|uniref:Spermidine/putrescine import ATP-binding protein n=1 Tax=Phaeobacter inhibens TaxID=221822 RepID=A0A2I7M452_9RHOB|nr:MULTISPECIES: ABC transporter ATP-binding protein [Phaeobacter]AFO89546.1 putative spermidine/putrescine import ATP-binding protein [Phaeobacter inhibens 2.10]AUQ52060.1 putative spermidine/putrescine import ATP-binding protein [Phaeobacter inhibens]AUQ96664.1 putative spermidine/putrescine import ATP-binding protein [Phaeobacter inhibens]AUR01176.1 putative spermidine/putrescine import ATP-binding protein [Phaeobacter inhibens]AUR05773.1 putative spermidine/putrescine import ATP-binding pr